MNNEQLMLGKFAKTVAGVMVGATIGNVALMLIGRAVSNPPASFGPYMYPSVIGLTVLGVLAGAAVYYGMRRWYADAAKANRHFIILSIVGLIVSFYPDISIPWSTDPDQVGWTYSIIANLMLMHFVVAIPVMYFFTRKVFVKA